MTNVRENKVNILQLICTLEVGGAEKLLIEQLKASKNLVANFTVVVTNNQISEYLKNELLSTNYTAYFLNRVKGDKNPSYLFKLLGIIRKHNIEIIHTHDPGSKNFSILLKLLHPGIKLVHTLHDTNIINSMNQVKLFLHRNFIDSSIAISQSVLEECHQYKVYKAAQIYNGINIQKYLNTNNKPDIRPELLNIINVSRIDHSKKGQDILIKALKKCKDRGLRFSCSFIGRIHNQKSYEYLLQLIKSLDLENEIKFLGNRDDIPELLKKYDLFVLPSRYEGFGLVVLEAMAAKVPVIASNIDGPAELITNGYNGFLFDSENYQNLADKIMEFYSDWEKMNSIVQNGYKFAQGFDISIMSKKYFELYKALIL